MKNTTRYMTLGIVLIMLATTFAVSGCVNQGPTKPAGIELQIQSAHTPEDHDRIAAEYEKQAAKDKAAAKTHQEMAVAYRNIGPKGNPGAWASHCNNLAKLYQQAADENLALAKLHHAVAADLSASGGPR